MTLESKEKFQSVEWVNPEIHKLRPGNVMKLQFGYGPVPSHLKNKRIFYFDIDNCLYNRSTKIHDMMQVKIHDYFTHILHLDDKDAHELHMTYYKVYGLAIEGLVRNHNVDALEYNSQVDDSLDLKSVLHYAEPLRNKLIQIKNSGKFDYFWLMTNAYKNHALRVVTFLGLGDLFDGLTYCDYSSSPIICKPMVGYFHNALHNSGIEYKNPENLARLSFVDDSEINLKAALDLGFGTVIHFIEMDEDYEKIIKKDDFHKYYGNGDNSDLNKIKIIRNILDLDSVL